MHTTQIKCVACVCVRVCIMKMGAHKYKCDGHINIHCANISSQNNELQTDKTKPQKRENEK